MKSFVLIFVLILCFVGAEFSWNPPINTDVSVSANPACPGHYDVTIGGVVYPCFGTTTDNVVTESSCPNGLQGIMINDTLTCGVITEYIPAGNECEFGGYRFLSNTQNFTNCYTNLTNFIDATLVNSPTVTFTINSVNISANAILSLFDVGVGGVSIIDHVVANSGFLKQFFGTGAVDVSTNISGIYIDVPIAITSISTAGGGISPIASSTPTLVTLKTFTNTPSVTFSTTVSGISADAIVTASDATSGGKTVISSYAANNIVLKQFFNDPTGVIQFTQTSSSINLLSLLTAYNLNFTGYNPSLFSDCPGITKASDAFVCLAQRTIGFVDNATSAGLVIYTPAIPFKNQSSFSVAQGFDYIFEDQSSAMTRTIYVNGEIGDDAVNAGGQFDPYATIDKAISVVPLVPFNQFYTILVSIDVYSVGNISFPPNTNLISYNRFKQTRLNFCSGCKITLSSSWSTFANDHVEAGISGFTLNGDLDIDFTTMGAAGANSDARVSFSESSILGTVQSRGRGNTDLFHVHNIEMHNGFTGNCQNIHAEYSSSLSSITLNDDNCFSNVTYLVIFNVFGVSSNLTIFQNTSTVHADVFLNAYDDNAFLVLRGGSQLFVDTYTIPLNYDADPNVTIVFTFNSQGGRSCGLNVAYFGSSCLNNADIIIAIRQRARLAITSGVGGVSAIFNTTIPNVIFNEFASVTDIFSVTASGTGLINFNINMFNTSNVKCPEGSFRLGTIGGYETCKPFAFTPTNLGVSFTTDNFLNFMESGSGLGYIVSYIGQLTFNDSTYFSVFKNPSGTFQVFFRNPLQDVLIAAGTNMVVTPGMGLGNFSVSTSLNPVFTTVTATSNVVFPSGASVKFNDTTNNATITVNAPAGLTQSYNLVYPPTPGTDGQVLQANGDGSTQWIGIRRRIFESCANGTANLGASSTAFNTLVAGTACATGPASKYIDANSVKVGTVFDMIIAGIISKNGASQIQTRVLINSTAIVTSVAGTLSGATSGVGFKATARCLFQTIGVSGSVLCTGDFIYDQMTIVQVLSTTIPVTVDTTKVLFFDFQLAYSAINSANFFTSSMTGMYIAL